MKLITFPFRLSRRLYDWVLGWADTPYGEAALFVLALAESSFFPIPPDPLLIALCLGAGKRSLRFAAIATGASVLGGSSLFGLGAQTGFLAALKPPSALLNALAVAFGFPDQANTPTLGGACPAGAPATQGPQ